MPRPREEIYIIVFNSSNESIHLYKILKDKRYDVEIMSTPCTISAGCSRAIKVQEREIHFVIEEIRRNKVSIRGIYKKVYKDSKFYYLKIQ
ncbi:DUF3343 domain-containing protein [Clostridium ganghwense]|uniref:DUF3343 domain-containing protein n=1 Tax=Clostridium ganghwense TaxID=312089 RepID=A0ABT4CR39_9CLOT|nr:DUF3343 domain-containing protein [Clostridium ganghwense]MCY6370546.1 DUF3343 domain-containing protein [Clostridium ganghwense]